jgi:hypothetical protein
MTTQPPNYTIETGFRSNENNPILFLKTPGDYNWPNPLWPMVMDTTSVPGIEIEKPLPIDELNGKTQIVWFYHNGNYQEEPNSFLYNGTVLDLIPQEWYKEVNAGRIHIIVHTAQESWGPIYENKHNDSESDNVHLHLEARCEHLGLRPESVTWITGDMNAEEYCKGKSRVNVKSICQFLYSIVNILHSNNLTPDDFYYEPCHPDDIVHFAISPNRFPKVHRAYILTRLWQLKHEVISYSNYNAINGYHNEVLGRHISGINWSFPKDLFGQNVTTSYCDLHLKGSTEYFNTKDLINWEAYRNWTLHLYYYLPFSIDPVDFSTNNCAEIDAMTGIKNEYNASAFSITTETWAEGSKMFISDALIMAIITCTPFIVLGNSGTLEFLKSKGFRTFGDFWDESYDDIEDDVERWEAVIQCVYNIGKLTTQQWKEQRMNQQDIVRHNFQTLFEVAEKEEQALYEYLHSI